MDPIEISELLETTKDLIEFGPSYDIVIRREGMTRTPSGGQIKGTPENIPEQRLYFSPTTGDPRYVQLTEGEKVETSHVLIGLPAADVKEKDEFIVHGRDFRVVEVHADRRYETRAWVIERH
jgi:hypothetical protein